MEDLVLRGSLARDVVETGVADLEKKKRRKSIFGGSGRGQALLLVDCNGIDGVL